MTQGRWLFFSSFFPSFFLSLSVLFMFSLLSLHFLVMEGLMVVRMKSVVVSSFFGDGGVDGGEDEVSCCLFIFW